MTTPSAAKSGTARPGQARGVTEWLALAAAPTFGVMAWIAVNDPAATALCSAGANRLPVDGMTAMYLLMSLFHLPPWLKLASGRPRSRT